MTTSVRTPIGASHPSRTPHFRPTPEVPPLDGGTSVTQTVTHTYDAANNWISRTVDTDGDGNPNERTVYVHDGGQIVLELEGDVALATDELTKDDLAHRYLWGPAVDMLLADEQVDDLFNAANNETLWALTDHLNSVRDLVDNEGDVRMHRAFDSFGEIMASTHYADDGATVVAEGQTGYVTIDIGYTGKVLDTYTGLQNNWHRWYDFEVGRWISEDPIKDEVNWHAYVGNMVTTYVDPDGLEKWNSLYGFNPWSWWGPRYIISGATGVHSANVESRRLDRQIRELNRLRAINDPANCDTQEFLQTYRASEAEVEQATTYAEFAVEANAFALGGGFIQPTTVIIDDTKIASYMFGRATGRQHNLERAAGNAVELIGRLNFSDDAVGHGLVRSHLESVVCDSSNITKTFSNEWGNFEVRESLLAGPNGKFAKVKSAWQVFEDGTRRFSTAIIEGGQRKITND